MDRRLYLVLLLLVVALGAYLRLVDLGGPALWHDEIIHLQAADALRQQPWYRHLSGIREVQGLTENGFAYYGLQMLGQRLAPGEVGARLFPAIVGILALPLIAFCGRLIGGRLVGLTAGFLLAVSPLHVYFSREGRPYSLLMFLALVLLLALLRPETRIGRVSAWGGCLVAAYAGLHSLPSLVAFLVLAAVAVMLDLWRRGSLVQSAYVQPALAAILGLCLVYGLYMTRTEVNTVKLDRMQSAESQVQSPVYESPLSPVALKRFLASMTTSGHQSVSTNRRSWLVLGLALVGLLAGARRDTGPTMATAGMFVLPALLSFAALALADRWYGLRYTAAASPAFLLLVAIGLVAVAQLLGEVAGRWRPGWRQPLTGLLAAVLLLLVAAPNVAAARRDPYRKLDWRWVASFFDEVALEGEPILIPNSWPRVCLGYYLRQMGREARFINLRESAETGEEKVASLPRGWLLTAGYRKTGEVRAWMHRFQPVLKRREEELGLFFFPDLETLMETRFAAGKGRLFRERFAAMGQRFDFGGAELTLQGRGWSYPEENKAGVRYQWAVGEHASLGLPVDSGGDATIRFRALPFVFPDAPSQTLDLRLNQSFLASIELPHGWSEHEVQVPKRAWSSQANVLYLDFGRTSVPAAVLPGASDRRSLSVAFDWLQVEIGVASGES